MKDRLKGVQLPLHEKVNWAYRAVTVNGSLVVCERHLEQLRKREEPNAVKLTGEHFPGNLCDHCHPEET